METLNETEPAVTNPAIESQTTTALAIVTRSVSEINAFEAGVAELERQYSGVVFQVDTTAGMKEACKAREEIRKPRYALQRMQKDAKAPLNELKKAIDEQAESFISRIEVVENPIHQQIANEERRKEAEKQAKADAERKRVAAIDDRINDIRESVALCSDKSSADIAGRITELEALAIDHTFAEFKERAETAKTATLVRLRAAHKSAEEREARERKLTEERAALEAQRVKDRALRAIRGRIDSIRSIPDGTSRKTAAAVQAILDTAKATVIDESFGELRDEARAALSEAVAMLGTVLTERTEHEAEQVRLAGERERLAEEQRKTRETAAENERKAEQLRLQQEKIEADAQAERDRIAAEDVRRVASPPIPEAAVSTELAEMLPAHSPVVAELLRAPPTKLVPGVATRWRPTDESILTLIGAHYKVPREIVESWIVGLADRLSAVASQKNGEVA